ncbi:MAG: TetR/AcrR family transcriptional regulator [Rhodopseudomonas palustris]|uniref:TetR/AcrR family transcriptional regulator n=1 Tax=Rhodopseudomonas palustris TaxID=1076 RepID=A0A933RU84_RHOPL|nr:TetR/AcrR family transcriptional regulator [Rhodopseudomonas palustris]
MPVADKKGPAKPRGLTNTGAAASRPRKTAAAGKAPAPASVAPSKRDLSLGRILDAAVHLFATKGYWNSSLEEVANVAGFTKGAVYYHFKSKERLLLKVLEIIETRSIDATIEHVHHKGGSPPERLASFVKHQTQWAAMHPEDLAVMILMSVEFSRAKSKIRSQMSRIYNKLGGTLEAIIDSGKATGDFTTQQNTKDIVLYLQAVHDGNMLIWYRSGNDPEIGRKLTRATLNGFAHAVQGS